MLNALSVDLEDWYQAISCIDCRKWPEFEDRLVESTDKALSILAQKGDRATFFVLGYNARRHPELIKRIQKAGHEIGCHGYTHKKVYEQTPEEFEADLVKTVNILEDITGDKVLGYRAPWFSINGNAQWALDILKKHKLKYDSSVSPFRNPYYGDLNILKKAGFVEAKAKNGLQRIPISTINLLGRDFPIGGGFYTRVFPYRYIKWSIKRLNARGTAACLYLHPWELDTEQPRLKLPLVEKIIHYTNLQSTEKKYKSLFSDFEFATIKEIFLKGT